MEEIVLDMYHHQMIMMLVIVNFLYHYINHLVNFMIFKVIV